MTIIYNILKHIDFISPPITLYYKNNLKHTSYFSIFLSILSFMLIVIFTVIFSLDFFLHKNPTAYYYNHYKEDVGIYPLNSSSLFHFITIGENIENFIYNKYSISVIGVNKRDDYILSNNNESSYDHWIYEKCDGSEANDKLDYLDEIFKSRFFKNGLCIKAFYNATNKELIYKNDSNYQDPILAHGNSNPNEILYGIFIQRCQNNTIINNNKCSDVNTIELDISTAFEYSIYYLEQNFDISNYKNPLKYFYYRLTNHFNNVSYTMNHLNFNPSLIRNHIGIIFDKINEVKTYVYVQNEKLVAEKSQKNKNENIYAIYYFWMQNIEQVYERNYKKLQDITGSVGGMIKLITIVTNLLNSFFQKYKLFKDLNNDILNNYKKIGEKIETSGKLKILGSTIIRNGLNYNINEKKNIYNIKKNNFIDKIDTKKKFNKHISENYLNSKNLLNANERNASKILEKLNKKISKTKTYEINNFFSITNKSLFSYYSPLNGYSQEINCFDVIKYLFKCKKKSNININIYSIENLDKFRKAVISEEGLFSYYFILKSFEKVLLHNNE